MLTRCTPKVMERAGIERLVRQQPAYDYGKALAIGVVIGVGIGLIIDNIAAGIGIGIAIGIALSLETARRKR